MKPPEISSPGLKDVLCPITFMPMEEVYSFVPCMHKVSREASVGIMNGANYDGLRCPICRGEGGSQPDRWAGRIVQAILRMGDFPVLENRLKREILCPLTNSPMEEAYSLVPCMHKVNRGALEVLNRQRWPSCPLCSSIVDAQCQDRWAGDMVKTLLKAGSNLSAESANLMQEEGIQLEEIPYPGIKGALEVVGGYWKPEGTLFEKERRTIVLESATPDSYLREMKIFGMPDGSIEISCSFRIERWIVSEIMKKYCSLFDLVFDPYGGYNLRCSNKDELANVLKLVSANNHIEERWLSLINDLVHSEDWRKVPSFELTVWEKIGEFSIRFLRALLSLGGIWFSSLIQWFR